MSINSLTPTTKNITEHTLQETAEKVSSILNINKSNPDEETMYPSSYDTRVSAVKTLLFQESSDASALFVEAQHKIGAKKMAATINPIMYIILELKMEFIKSFLETIVPLLPNSMINDIITTNLAAQDALYTLSDMNSGFFDTIKRELAENILFLQLMRE